MKNTSLWVVLCLFFMSVVFLLHIMTVYLSLTNPVDSIVTSRASSSQGTLSFTVEGDASCGDNSCNGNETCSTCSADCGSCSTGGDSGSSSGGGGGGGGSYIAPTPETEEIYSLIPTEFNVFMTSGAPVSKEIKVKNLGTEEIELEISANGISEFVSFSQDKILLQSGEETLLFFHLLFPQAGVYAGKINFVSSDGTTKEVFVVANVQEGAPLFDVSLTIPAAYKIINLGEKVKSLLTLTQIGEPTQVDVTIRYLIKDFNGDTLMSESETVAIIGSDSFSKELDTSKLPVGEYILGAEVLYPLGVATSSDSFDVTEKEFDMIYVLILLLILAILAIAYSVYKYKKSGAHRRR